ncbi:ethanolamine ammonia-lyase subunit EutC [Methylovorus sp. MP688]|uniref:ethanolamine ammonia-lyase subunit EutC n=1 Tax=Methylovorus sp. (strain MP688) TaxID=887061 RepID=UPI0001EC4603|nr:ethanolamine ammonia-lyase subunit EutC [Methylovorus sp. MP688]ADQ84166.1 Ethanolamine ammonia-lyase [Methylovorus sp. MP688]
MNENDQPIKSEALADDPWQQLKGFTRARIALGRVGSSLPTREVLDFGMSHAMARDAVHLALDMDQLAAGIAGLGYDTVQVNSCAPDRATYLLRPDLGRRLSEADSEKLLAMRSASPIDLLIVVGDGLSSLAVERHVQGLLAEIKAIFPPDWSTGPVVLVRQARVAIADTIGELLNARMVAMLIGERPGLSSPDSLGVYLTYDPRTGRNDADRNCISNVRPEGLMYAAAARKLLWLARESMRLKLSGVALKDESDAVEIEVQAAPRLPGESA